MTSGASLALRVVGYLVIAQFIAFWVAWMVTIGLGLAHIWIYDTTLELVGYLSGKQFRDCIAGSRRRRSASYPALA